MKHTIPIVENILSANDRLAAENHTRLDADGVFAINLMASPGAGKTSLILATLEALAGRLRLGVIEGDLAGSIDADKAAAAGIPAVQINTGGECHLDAVMVRGALDSLPLGQIDLLIIENVGNLVCPAAFQLGSHLNLLIASIPEGDDKPYKYPGMYRGVQALVINKTDLLPYVPFNMDYFRRGVEALNPGLATFPLSCRTGDGLPAFADWLVGQVQHGRKKNPR
jgi:hydrogenase nickel incorporation protein HypB